MERGTFSNYPQNAIVVRTNIVLNLAIIGESQYVRSYRSGGIRTFRRRPKGDNRIAQAAFAALWTNGQP
jgi:hypothetical protein